MDVNALKRLLADVQAGSVSVDDALDALKLLPYQDVGFARLDHHRALRKGHPEVIFSQGKTPDQVGEIAERLNEAGVAVLATRADRVAYEAVSQRCPTAIFHELARCIVVPGPTPSPKGSVLVVSAGTADIPVAEEAAITAEVMGSCVERLYDVGVAGLHRLLDKLPVLRAARVIVVVAGMEGALASVVGGLVEAPVIAVPTSVGYGAHFQGLAPLLSMLNACAPGIAVVNIDNGYGAGYLANLINLAIERAACESPTSTVPAASPGT